MSLDDWMIDDGASLVFRGCRFSSREYWRKEYNGAGIEGRENTMTCVVVCVSWVGVSWQKE